MIGIAALIGSLTILPITLGAASAGADGPGQGNGGQGNGGQGNVPVDGYPLGLPGTPVANVSQCPASPGWSQPLPPGATVSPPTLSSGGGLSLGVGGSTQTESGLGRCSYTVTTPGDPVTFIDYGSSREPFGAVINGTIWNSNSQPCSFSTIAGQFYVAFAEIMNTSGYCNTDGSGNWSKVQIVNSNLQAGPVATTNQFQTWVQSAIAGSPFFWSWRVCLEDPVGQHVNYYCGSGNMSPLYN
jgi:hypothetical protein